MTPVLPASYTTRRATAEDAPGIGTVHVKSWRETYQGIVPNAYLEALSAEARASMWGSIIAATRSVTTLPWVAVGEGAEIVGFASSGPARSPEFGGYGELYAIYLLNRYKGQGIGKELFGKAKADLVAGGFGRMMLWVLKDNPTLEFYLRQGGKVVEEKAEDIGGASLIECAVVWTL